MKKTALESTTPIPQKPKKNWWQRLWLKPFFIRLSSWEYWPLGLISIPTFFYWLYLSARARSFFWFSATNPGIESGGMIGELKEDIHQLIPDDLMPLTAFVPAGTSEEEAIQIFQKKGLEYPVMAKPDIGGRGVGVRKIRNEEDLKVYQRDQANIAYHLQAFVDYKIEAGVMHYQMPNSEESGIISVTLKKFLSITGDGISTCMELIEDNPRAILVKDTLIEKYGERLQKTLPNGEELILQPIGNHSRGTMFLDGNYLINEEMIKGFDKITHRIDGVYFSRYDLRCPSLEDLQAGRNIMILEINGTGADPAHIFDPKVPLLQKYKVIFKQWKIMFRIARANRKNGLKYMTWKEARRILKRNKEHHKTVKSQ